MKYAKLLSAIPVICCLLSVGSARADGDPVTITITGNIVASPCQVDADSTNIGIALGDDIQASSGVTAGTNMSGTKNTQIKLINCPAGTSSVTATFHGTPDPGNPDFMYKNTGTATNVAVVLQADSNTGLGDGKTKTIDVDENKQAIFPLESYAYSLGGATPGTISSVVTVSFTYN